MSGSLGESRQDIFRVIHCLFRYSKIRIGRTFGAQVDNVAGFGVEVVRVFEFGDGRMICSGVIGRNDPVHARLEMLLCSVRQLQMVSWLPVAGTSTTGSAE